MSTDKRVLDARPDTMDFRDQMFVPTLVEVPAEMPLERYLAHKVPVLDQGKEGACTGYGLATVANYLLQKRFHATGQFSPVSPWMFYVMARRYDEWPGDQHVGSSARGAMKGWNKHGVCTDSDWPSQLPGGDHDYKLSDERIRAARRHPLGAYFRVNHKDIVAMHAAIAEVGILYASAMVHEGWTGIGADGIVRRTAKIIGGHAFAIVGYNEQGFWIQNSWGDDWGRGGMCLVSYDDWLENGTDVWVARLGAPIQLREPESFAVAHAGASGHSDAYAFAQLRPHIVSLGNEGRLKSGGDYETSEEDVIRTFEREITQLAEQGKIRHVLLFAHGGLTAAKDAAQRVAEYRGALLEAGVYPVAFIWNSDYWTTLRNVLGDAFRRTRPEGFLDDSKDFLQDRIDDMLEPLARRLTGKLLWDEMKENAMAASGPGGGAALVAACVADLKKRHPDIGIHLVGHSAGAILHAPFAQLLGTVGTISSGPASGMQGHGVRIDSCTLWAPACTMDVYRASYKPLIDDEAIERFAVFTLSDEAERDDDCVQLYKKSLLYLVSHAFEERPRIPLLRDGATILGMARDLANDKQWNDLVKENRVEWIVAPNNEPAGSPHASSARHHGDFDNDRHTVLATLSRIVGGAGGPDSAPKLKFSEPRGRMIARRKELDRQSAVVR